MGCDTQFDGLYDSKPTDPFDDEWYRLGFDRVSFSSSFSNLHTAYECQGCFSLAKNYKAHHEVCDKAVIRERKVTTTPVMRKK